MYTIGGYLYHHGIQGQKWGKRNGPPYPLKPGDHSAAEKKAAKGKKSIEGGSRTEGSLRKKISNHIFKKSLKRYDKYMSRLPEEQRQVIEEMQKRHLDDIKDSVKASGDKEVEKLVNDLMISKFGDDELDKIAHDRAKKAGKDKGDNYKVYRDAMQGDEKAKEVIDSWESSETEKLIRKKAYTDVYGDLEFRSKEKLPVRINVGDKNITKEKKDEMIKAAAKVTDYFASKENLSKVKDDVVDSIIEDNVDYINYTYKDKNKLKESLKNNLRMYYMHVDDSKGDNVTVELNFEHRDMFDPDSAPYGDHSIDVEAEYNTKTKKITINPRFSING